MARIFILAYRVPLAVLDGILQWIPQDDLDLIHWLIASYDANSMQSFDSIWSARASLAMCIFPDASEDSDEALFELSSVECPAGVASTTVLHCDGQKPRGSLSEFESLVIDLSRPSSATIRRVASELSSRTQNPDG
ncbi:MAG: hypothetical protein Q7K57_58120 [Burkholderiaceae bacterium]|nr:hypothetical protein [Burkholderiaceae bacterium]